MSDSDRHLRGQFWPTTERWLRLVESIRLLDRASLFRFLVPLPAWLDTLVLASVLLAINSAVNPADLGWLHWTPTPYFLLPLLVGSRYGFFSGVFSGAGAAAIIFTRFSLIERLSPVEIVTDHGYLFLALVATGALCGEIQSSFRKKELQLTASNSQLRTRLQQLDANLSLLLETKTELERLLASRDSELSTLDADIRRLSLGHPEELPRDILFLIHHRTRVSDAGLYLLDQNGQLVRRGLMGDPRFLPERFQPEQIELAAAAFENKAPASLPEFWHNAPTAQQPHLAAIPLLDSDDEPFGLVLITGLPFIALHQRTIHALMVICRWGARILEMHSRPEICRVVGGAAAQKIYSANFFRHSLDVAYHSYRLYRLPSAVALLALPGQPPSAQPAFEQVLLATIRDGDCAAVLDLSFPHLAVLLPLTGQRGAEIFRDRLLRHCHQHLSQEGEIQCHVSQFDPRTGPDELLQRIFAYGQELAPHH